MYRFRPHWQQHNIIRIKKTCKEETIGITSISLIHVRHILIHQYKYWITNEIKYTLTNTTIQPKLRTVNHLHCTPLYPLASKVGVHCSPHTSRLPRMRRLELAIINMHTKFELEGSSLSRSRDILEGTKNLKWFTWRDHAHFRDGFQSYL